MLSPFFILFLYASLWVWFFGGFTAKKPEKKKTPEELLGESLSKYLSSLDIPKKS
ncbi:hypothetical protein [Coleofasciculus sp. E1-EBD-02]|uniref:hypothetical protein n=1 Tax=Coleofasciculus sp. E1-EBD-02 TaxID=3068481 RepID=UPI0032F41B6E